MLNYFQCININMLVNNNYFRIYGDGTSLEVQVVKNPPSNAGDMGSIPGWSGN